MDKNRMDDDRNLIVVHQTPPGIMQSVHRDYGLMILGGGTGVHAPKDSFLSCRKRRFEHFSISHLLGGGGHYWLEDGREADMSPGDAIIVTPDTVNRYGGFHGEPYIEDSLAFFGPVADMLKQCGVVRDGVFPFGTVRRLLPIQQLQRDPAHVSQIKANIELQKLLVDIYLESLGPVSGYPVFEKLLSDIKSRPKKWWTVQEMAEYCGISDDQLRRVFMKYTGCSPKFYIDRLKLRHAGELLTSTRHSIAAISDSLGYLDRYHFSRRFKQIMGLSPQRYRDSGPNAGRFLEAGRDGGGTG